MSVCYCFGLIFLLVLGFVEALSKMTGNEILETANTIGNSKSIKKLHASYLTTNFDPDLVKALQNSPYRSAFYDFMNHLKPKENKIVFTVHLKKPLTQDEAIHSLNEAVADNPNIKLEFIKVSKFEAEAGMVKMFFMHITKNDNDTHVIQIKLTTDAIEQFMEKRFQYSGVVIKASDIYDVNDPEFLNSGKLTMESMFSDKNWDTWQLAIMITATLFGVFLLSLLVVFLATYGFIRNKVSPVEEPRHVIVQPVLRPAVAGVGVIQPENRDQRIDQVVHVVNHVAALPVENPLPESDSEHTSSPSRSPMRRGRGLLERRGSNASLTLDLNRSQENIHCGTPPKECSTQEYLQSAGKRLTRRQLRSILRDVKGLHSEFWEIPMNHPEKVEVAGSGTKNRYKTILPNENTRVLLYERSEDPLSSYINANYIRGYGGEINAYIATQGPLPHTVDDFWLMVWKEKCPIIVMITKLKEKMKVKCEPYIPDYQDRFSDIEVTVMRVVPREGYTIRELFLRRGSETHTVHHFWYTTWPDHKTPETAKQLLAMALEVEGLRHDNSGATKGPMIVHCSAGIGRTGCFIATSIGIQQLLEENCVDVLGIVCSLRVDRGGMIQTAEQYEFVHQALSIFELTMPGTSVD